jgi:hypothetical protein
MRETGKSGERDQEKKKREERSVEFLQDFCSALNQPP